MVWFLPSFPRVFVFQLLSHVRLCDPMKGSMPDLPILHKLLELDQTLVHCPVSDIIQSSRPLLSSFPPAFNCSQHQSLLLCVGSFHQVAKVLELQLQNQSFQ